ncbi:hypothetical protein BD410DRAFT_686583, partial [Rickenella mellea]
AYLLKDEFGELWRRLVRLWLQLEESYGFISPVTGLGTTHRPSQIEYWVSRGRKGTPDIGNIASFAKGWWLWWAALQPAWRTFSSDGRPCIAGEGSWEALRKPGRNGLLSVLATLVWWRKELGEDATPDWEGAVFDVEWAMHGLSKEAKSGKR